tara:strand:- start:179 stop:670 length:492 start_codon:yes stop_codon:yes gene_type:complete
MAQIEILVEDNRWTSTNLEELVKNAFYQTLIVLGYSRSDYFVSVLGCNDNKMRELNHTFRCKDNSTNVLSWPSRERSACVEGNHPRRLDPALDAELGDIALSYETCLEEAAQSKTSFSFHVQHLVVHGILHLLGYDHSSDQDATLMEDLERKILGNLSLNAHT